MGTLEILAPGMPFLCSKALVGLLSLIALVDLALFITPLIKVTVITTALGSKGGWIYLMFGIIRLCTAFNLRERGTWFICVMSMLVELVMIIIASKMVVEALMPAIVLLALACVSLVWLLIVRPGGEVMSDEQGAGDTTGKVTPDGVNAWSDSDSDTDSSY